MIEGRVSCSINWFSRRPLDVNYNIVIFFTTFILPFFIILFCNLRVLFMVSCYISYLMHTLLNLVVTIMSIYIIFIGLVTVVTTKFRLQVNSDVDLMCFMN